MYLAFLYMYFIWLALQNFLLPLAYQQQWLFAGTLGLLMAGKEVVMVLALLALGYRAFQKGWRFNAADKFAFAYAILLTLYLALGPLVLGSTVPFFIRAVSARALVSLVIFYFWGRLSYLEISELKKFIRFVLGLQIGVAIFGLIEWTFLPTSFWSETVGVGNFMLDVKGLLEGMNVVDGLPGNMFRFDIRRIISTYGDPLSMGIACVFPLLLCLAWLLWRKRNGDAGKSNLKWILAAAVLSLALLLTIGRESIGAALLGAALLVWWSGKAKGFVAAGVVAVFMLMLLPQFWTNFVDTVTFRESSAAEHLQFLQSGWNEAPKLLAGKGLGEAGGWAYSLAGVESEVGENSYFELMSQAGLLAVIFLVGFLIASGSWALWYARKIPDPLISAALYAAAANIAARAVLAMFSPSLFGVVPMASFLFLCGAAFTSMQKMGLRPGLVLRPVKKVDPALALAYGHVYPAIAVKRL
ncbi:MAG TPA: hypothetical protein VIB39_14520 [Candidatus Angelobacter sp.]|jgi:hypothetical protein